MRLLRAVSSQVLIPSENGGSTTSPGNLFNYLQSNFFFFLISNQYFPRSNLFCCLLSYHHTLWRRVWPPFLYILWSKSCRQQSGLSRPLFSKLNRPDLSDSPCRSCLAPANLIQDVNILVLGSPNWTQYSKGKCTIEGEDVCTAAGNYFLPDAELHTWSC